MPPAAAGARAPAGPAPTHVLVGDLAHRIDERPLVLGSAPPADARGLTLPLEGLQAVECRLWRAADGVVAEDAGGTGCAVNGAALVGRCFLRPGDRLQVGRPGIVLVLVREAEA